MSTTLAERFSNGLRAREGTTEDVLRRGVVADMLDDFVTRLHEQQVANLLQVVLFGSVARGDDTEGSDVDLFILLRRDDDAIRLDIASICSDISLDHSWRGCGMIKLSPIIMSLDEYRAEWRSSLLFHYIREEGVDIWL